MKNSGIKAGGAGFDRIFKALGDPHRIQIIELLREKELSAGEILEAVDVVQSTLSHHMKTLADSGVVNTLRRGKWTYYSLNKSALADATKYLQVCSEGTKIMRKESELSGEMPKRTAGSSAKRIISGDNGKPSVKSTAQSTSKTTEKGPAKSAGKTTAKTAVKGDVQATAKSAVKEAEKSGKKKDKKGKKSKKGKK